MILYNFFLIKKIYTKIGRNYYKDDFNKLGINKLNINKFNINQIILNKANLKKLNFKLFTFLISIILIFFSVFLILNIFWFLFPLNIFAGNVTTTAATNTITNAIANANTINTTTTTTTNTSNTTVVAVANINNAAANTTVATNNTSAANNNTDVTNTAATNNAAATTANTTTATNNGGWLKVDIPQGQLVWVDTSHWEKKLVLVKDGYYKDIVKKRWVDTSYTVNQGYWAYDEYKVWVKSSAYVPYTAYRYVDTSHWVTEYYWVEVYKPVNFTVIKGTDSYGWSVYSFAAQTKGMQQVTYNGEKYYAIVYVINYKPARGGQIYAEKYVFLYKIVKEQRTRTKWVSSGYWEAYTAYKLIDTSHWETRTGKHWVDTSYRVESGYWQEYTEKQWVDTSHYEYRDVWVNSGFYTEPLHGKITIQKDPKYIFTKWHKDENGSECKMYLKISWEIFDNNQNENQKSNQIDVQVSKKISKIYVYQETYRYKNNPVDKNDLYLKNIVPSQSGFVEFFSFFNYAGDQRSTCHIYLFTEDNQAIHAYFSNPINGFKSVNIKYDGTLKDADRWLGGNGFGQAEF